MTDGATDSEFAVTPGGAEEADRIGLMKQDVPADHGIERASGGEVLEFALPVPCRSV